MDENRMIDAAEKCAAFWAACQPALAGRSGLPANPPQAWHFCSNPADADALGELARRGVKTATASLYAGYAAEGEEVPRVGDLNIITNWAMDPLILVEITELEIVPFGQVSARQAYDEGEGDRSLDYWREVHWRFFSDEARALGIEVTEDMLVVCEHFKILYPTSDAG